MNRRLVALTALYGIAFSLTALVMSDRTLAIDERILRWLNSLATGWLNSFVNAVTYLGEPFLLTGFSIAFFGYLMIRKRVYEGIVFAAAMAGTSIINICVKYGIGRDRPELWEAIVRETSYSFPSGHAMGAASLALILMYLYRKHPLRRWLFAAALVFMVVVSVSRLYLGVHYPSDILAGWAFSAAWVLTVITAARFALRR